MKTMNFFLGASGLALGAFIAGAQAPMPEPLPGSSNFANDLRDLYVSNATLQLQTYHWDLDVAARSGAPSAPAGPSGESLRLMKELDGLVVRLRSAAPSEFEAVKATFERARVALDRSLGRSVD